MVSDLQRNVLEAVQAGAALAEIESTLIEPARLDEDEKAALWLYADSLRELGSRERQLALPAA